MLHCCQDMTRKVRADVGAEPREFNDRGNHLHLLPGYPPKTAISALVNSLTGVPTRRLRTQFTGQVNQHIMHGHFWPPPYLAASCGGTPPGTIQQYIDQQKRPVDATSGLTPPWRTGPGPGHYGQPGTGPGRWTGRRARSRR